MSAWSASDLPDFDQWWEEHGQFLRAGGTEYAHTFAYEAWKHLKGGVPTKPEQRTLYFVTYSYSAPTKSGSGWIAIWRTRPIVGVEDIQELQKNIEKGDPTLGKVVVMGWQCFEEDL